MSRRPTPHRFAPSLRRLADDLDLPHEVRVEILAEVARDLEGLYRAARRRGLAEGQAMRYAEARAVPSPEAAARLARLHATAYRRFLRRFTRRGARRLEAAGIGALSLLVLGFGAAVAWRSGLLPGAGPGLWVVAALGAAVAVESLRAAHRLWIRREPPVGPRSGVALFTFGAASLCLAVTVALLGLGATAEAAAARALPPAEVAGRLGRQALLVTAGLSVTFAAWAMGSLFTARAQAMRRAELEYLIAGRDAPATNPEEEP